jgi:hypothetical protein
MGGTLLTLLILSIQPRVVINEVMANPRGPDSHAHYPEDRNEFVELYNLSDDTIELQGWHLTDFDDVDTLSAWTDTLIRVKYGASVRTNSTLLYPHSFALILDPEYVDTAPEGGYVQPYHFGDRCLLLRPGNTTIGNGLSAGDTVMLWSLDSTDVSTFGTWPGGPVDPGDGVSWERVSTEAPDAETCWVRCVDSAGGTPGRENSIVSYCNLACREVLCRPLSFMPGTAETVFVTVANTGRTQVSDWSVSVLLGTQGERGEQLGLLRGVALLPGRETTLSCLWPNPEHGFYNVVAQVICPGDQDDADNRDSTLLRLTPHAQSFCLQAEQFGPELTGYPESLGITYSLPDSKGNLRVTVYDLNARERATVFDGRPSAMDGMLYWNGTGRAGNTLPVGIYIVVCEYKSGKQVIYEKKPVVLAKG